MPKSLTYADSGVDIDKGNRFVDTVKKIAKKTSRAGVMGDIGGFGGMFSLNVSGMEKPVLVSATDGVGNYIRNSVKVVVDAYDGKVWLYVVDPDDPVIQTYQKIFPQIFLLHVMAKVYVRFFSIVSDFFMSAAVLNAIAMFVHSGLTLWLNRTSLPKSIGPNKFRTAVMSFASTRNWSCSQSFRI